MDRPYFHSSIEDLEALFKKKLHNRVELAYIREELLLRDTDRSRQLLKEVQGVLEALVPVPRKPPPPDAPDNQLPLISE